MLGTSIHAALPPPKHYYLRASVQEMQPNALSFFQLFARRIDWRAYKKNYAGHTLVLLLLFAQHECYGELWLQGLYTKSKRSLSLHNSRRDQVTKSSKATMYSFTTDVFSTTFGVSWLPLALATFDADSFAAACFRLYQRISDVSMMPSNGSLRKRKSPGPHGHFFPACWRISNRRLQS